MDRKNAQVSVIVPVYGTEQYLPTCIESILNQSYSNLQIILIDDESPDACPEICDQYAEKDPRILVIHQKNTGVSGARNTGLRHLSGEYVMFVDSDDELYENAVDTLLCDAVTYNADIVSAYIKTIYPNGNISIGTEDGTRSLFLGEQAIYSSLQGDDATTSACAKLFKTLFIKDITFQEGQNVNEDGFYLFQCYLRQPVLVQHNVAVYQCNVRLQSNSRKKFSDHYLSILYFGERKKELIAKHYPQYMEQVHNMEVRTNLQMLDVLCSTTERKYKPLEKQCVGTVRKLYRYHRPINNHHKMLAWIVACGLYPLYKRTVHMKYYS